MRICGNMTAETVAAAAAAKKGLPPEDAETARSRAGRSPVPAPSRLAPCSFLPLPPKGTAALPGTRACRCPARPVRPEYGTSRPATPHLPVSGRGAGICGLASAHPSSRPCATDEHPPTLRLPGFGSGPSHPRRRLCRAGTGPRTLVSTPQITRAAWPPSPVRDARAYKGGCRQQSRLRQIPTAGTAPDRSSITSKVGTQLLFFLDYVPYAV